MAELRNSGTTTPRGRPFQRGNPGKQHGTRAKATLAAEALLDGEVEGLTRRAIEMALDGDVTALRLCLERILPARKERPVTIVLPVIASLADASAASAVVLGAVASGELLPAEGAALAQLLEAHCRIMEG